MRRTWMLCAAVVLLLACRARAQYEGPAESVVINGAEAFTWMQGGTSVVQVTGPVSIEVGKNTMSADNAVVWVSPLRGSVADTRRVEFALVGNAKLVQANQIERTARQLFVDARVRGPVRMAVPKRGGRDMSNSELYKQAVALRPVLLPGGETTGQWVVEQQPLVPPAPTTQPQAFRPTQPVSISADHFLTDKSSDGKVVAILSGKVSLIQRTKQNDVIELLADKAVVFTPYNSLTETQPGQELKQIEDSVTGVYLEGDVRITHTPHRPAESEQRLLANRAYYDFTRDRAILTDAVLQTVDPKNQIPMVVRARIIRQLSDHEYTAEKAQISTSTFHTPSYSIGTSTLYVRQTDIGNEVTGTRTNFVARHNTFDVYGVPVFYWPVAAGSITEQGMLRRIEMHNSNAFGFGVSSEWGLFETLGEIPPKNVDASYHMDFFSKRGPATGLDFKYKGGFVDENTLNPWSYSGDFTSYVVPHDMGKDDLGRNRLDVDPEQDFRGRFYWRHQHFLPDDWQVQITGGYISDPTFQEEWFRNDFRTRPPQDTSLYLKRQQDSEAITFLVSVQPNDFATAADVYQEQAEVERLPELGYHRIGESLWDDRLTVFSSNSLSALHFKTSDSSLGDLGFKPAPVGFLSPGIPSFGQTGTPDDYTYRGDFRQEVTAPFSLYQFRTVPYVVGRLTEYSESVDGGQAGRVYMGGGVRMTTAFWKVDDSVKSEFWDLHRLRHVVEPEMNLYTSVQSKDRNELLIYDEPIDAITDISAIQLALNQRWQTKRGGPGEWRSVDFFSFNVQWNYFFSQPPEAELNPTDFRGLYFVSRPETSIARNSLNAQTAWRVTEAATINSELYYNTDENVLSTASIGLTVQADPRFAYHLEWRHIGLDFVEVVNGNTFVFDEQELFIFAIDYELTARYRLNTALSYDFAQNRWDRAAVAVTRRFDRFYVSVGARVDRLDDESAVFVNAWPEGLKPGGGSNAASSFLGR